MKTSVRFFCILNVMLVLSCFSTSILAFANSNDSNEQIVEEKIMSNATMEDDFSEDRVLVVLKHDISMQNKSYVASDFSDIKCKNISNLTTCGEASTESFVDLSNNSLANSDNFRQILSIDLQERGKGNVLKTIKALEKRDDVFYVGPDYRLSISASNVSGDYNSQQWGLDKIQASNAWTFNEGYNVVIGVLDTGIAANHPSLVNSIHSSGHYDFVANQASSALYDDAGHGTMVAGVIAATSTEDNNIKGIAYGAKLVSLKVFDAAGVGWSSAVVAAITRAMNYNIKILNLSGSWQEDFNMSTYDVALETAISNYNGLFVCSAGNKNRSNDLYEAYPANFNFNNMITVGASSSDDGRWGESTTLGSNFGQKVDLFAPGDKIYSTYYDINEGYYDYGIGSGTSFAAPFVTGVAAIMMNAYDTSYSPLTPYDIKMNILQNVDVVSYLNGECSTNGRLNAYEALLNFHYHTHDYSIYSQNNGTTHYCVCSYCGLSTTETHTYTYVSNGASGHTGTCVCGYTITGAHTGTYTNNGTIGHTISCNVCGTNVTTGHSYTYVSNGASGHSGTCACGATTSGSHTYSYVSTSSSVTHNVQCNYCSYYYTENHTWMEFIGFYKCSKCGKKNTFVPINSGELPEELLALLMENGYVLYEGNTYFLHDGILFKNLGEVTDIDLLTEYAHEYLEESACC